MKGPLERMARALCSLDGHPENIQFEGRPMWESYLPNARVALEALREPTGAMLQVAGPIRDAERIWKSMIDMALAKGD